MLRSDTISDSAEPVQAHLTIRGLVQGVYFRARLKERAGTEGVGGWARNVPDGSVEALLVGSRADVDAVIAWARVGPAGATVESVAVQWAPRTADPIAHGFEIR